MIIYRYMNIYRYMHWSNEIYNQDLKYLCKRLALDFLTAAVQIQLCCIGARRVGARPSPWKIPEIFTLYGGSLSATYMYSPNGWPFSSCWCFFLTWEPFCYMFLYIGDLFILRAPMLCCVYIQSSYNDNDNGTNSRDTKHSLTNPHSKYSLMNPLIH